MTREEIKAKFREEMPEATDRVITNDVLNTWCIAGNLEVACMARLIKGETTFSSVIGQRGYDLTSQISNFYDIDDLPGGGVIYDSKALDLTTIAQLDIDRPSWRTEGNGTPKEYWRRNNYLYFDQKPQSIKNIIVYTVLKPDSFDDDNKTPFNQYTHLESFHDSILYYLIKRAKAKIGKGDEAKLAREEYSGYVNWMKQEVNRGIYDTIEFRPKTSYVSGASSFRNRRR